MTISSTPLSNDLLDYVSSGGPLTVNTNQPTDIAIGNAIAVKQTAKLFVITGCFLQAGTATTAVNLAFGIHHPDGSGGSTVQNIEAVAAPRAFEPIFAGYAFTSANLGQDWTDATFRTALTQVGATGNGSAFMVFLAVFAQRTS